MKTNNEMSFYYEGKIGSLGIERQKVINYMDKGLIDPTAVEADMFWACWRFVHLDNYQIGTGIAGRYVNSVLYEAQNKPILWDSRKFVMTEEEYKILQSLIKNPVKIYRGVSDYEAYEGYVDGGGYGTSWTLDETVAKFFAHFSPNFYGRHGDRVEWNKVDRYLLVLDLAASYKWFNKAEDLFAYFDGNEKEVLLCPWSVPGMDEIEPERLRKMKPETYSKRVYKD